MADIDAFLAGIGVNTHVDATNTPYGDVAGLAGALSYLGIDLIRDHAYDIDIPGYQVLAAAGVRLDLIVDSDPAPTIAVFAPLVGAIASFEGANEVDIYPVIVDGIADPVAAAIAAQRGLFEAVRASPTFAALPVLNQTVSDPAKFAAYAATGATASVYNIHAYPVLGTSPRQRIVSVAAAIAAPPGTPVVLTETGYYTLPNNDVDASGVDESVQARLILDALLDDFELGLTQTFLYELFDQAADPNGLDTELHYGLFRADGSAKPVATAIHNLTTILRTTGISPAGLNPDASGLPETGHSLVLTKRDGPTDIVLWAEPKIWDPDTKAEIAADPASVTVTLGAVADAVSVYDPILGTAAIATYRHVAQLVVELTDHPIIIQVEGAATPTERSIGVYRFFDTGLGTHFYTADPVEAAAIRSTRPDLLPEGAGGVGLRAIDPASGDPAAVPVYRFFDRSDGTHFLTASTAERDEIILSRADLAYEPGSVFYEHLQPGAGDIPVYRFFDARLGTHFYTDNGSERAAILTTRPDLVPEGIGFYEPSPAG